MALIGSFALGGGDYTPRLLPRIQLPAPSAAPLYTRNPEDNPSTKPKTLTLDQSPMPEHLSLTALASALPEAKFQDLALKQKLGCC